MVYESAPKTGSYPPLILESVLCTNSSLFGFKTANEYREFRNYLNLLKSGLNAGFTFLLYKPVTTALRKAGYISGSQNMQGRKPVGLWMLSGVIVITCILLILSLNGIL